MAYSENKDNPLNPNAHVMIYRRPDGSLGFVQGRLDPLPSAEESSSAASETLNYLNLDNWRGQSRPEGSEVVTVLHSVPESKKIIR